MKKIAAILFILTLLCAMVAAGFYLVTQRGVFAREVSVYIPGSDTPVLADTLKLNESNLIIDTLKSTEKVEAIPPRFGYEITLHVIYRPDITKHYPIYINPFTGEGCIEKGLLKKTYYIISSEIMDYILSSDSIVLYNENELPDSEPLEAGFYPELRSSLEYIGGKPGVSINTTIYTVIIETPVLESVQYDILLDLENETAYAGTPEGYYSISEDMTKSLFSMEMVYDDYKEIMQPIPKILLSAEMPLNPSYTDIRWIRLMPTDEPVSESILESSRSEIETLEPGQVLMADYKPGQTPDGIILYEYHNGELFMEYDLLSDAAVVPDFEGSLEYKLKAIYEVSSYPNSYGTISLDYSFIQNLPTSVEILYSEARPGDILAFFIDYSEEGESFSLESNLGDFEADFMHYGGSYVMYMPINWWTAPKDYTVTIYRYEEDSKEAYEVYKITVLPDDFETIYQELVVSDELAEKADPANTANDYIMVREAKSHSNETSYLDGLFILPLTGEFGTSYAQTRYINGENPYRHSGLDIDGDTGDPIIAANSGEVVFSGELVRTGNTVIIDHGMELFSSYLHMSELDVTKGDFVEKGDLIGKVGSTGFSTGPHLHWSITLYGNYMSPMWLVENPIVPN